MKFVLFFVFLGCLLGAVFAEDASEEAKPLVPRSTPGLFGMPIKWGSNWVRNSIRFPKTNFGAFELELQNQSPKPRTLKVNRNGRPGRPPQGWASLEPYSFKIRFQYGSSKTAAKIHYVFDVSNPAIWNFNVTTCAFGKYNAQTKMFNISDALGPFWVDPENSRMTLLVNTQNVGVTGEWGVFTPLNRTGTGDTKHAAKIVGRSVWHWSTGEAAGKATDVVLT